MRLVFEGLRPEGYYLANLVTGPDDSLCYEIRLLVGEPERTAYPVLTQVEVWSRGSRGMVQMGSLPIWLLSFVLEATAEWDARYGVQWGSPLRFGDRSVRWPHQLEETPHADLVSRVHEALSQGVRLGTYRSASWQTPRVGQWSAAVYRRVVEDHHDNLTVDERHWRQLGEHPLTETNDEAAQERMTVAILEALGVA